MHFDRGKRHVQQFRDGNQWKLWIRQISIDDVKICPAHRARLEANQDSHDSGRGSGNSAGFRTVFVSNNTIARII
jgi:hypothetical protein